MDSTKTLAESSRANFAIPAVVAGRYEIEKELGRGGFAIAYRALDKHLYSRSVVVKVLLEHQQSQPWALKKFRQEMEVLAKIDDPGIVGALDSGELPDGRPFFVMQFIDGKTLREVLKAGQVGAPRAGAILRDIGKALSAAHAAGVYHRDLKPANIMLQRRSGDEIVKLIDFGIASVRNAATQGAPKSMVIAGTPQYMAPEQFEGEVSAQTDIYAMGIIAFELITGQLPFPAAGLVKAFAQRQMVSNANLCQLRPELPAGLAAILAKALAFDASQRYEQATELGELLSQVLSEGVPATLRKSPPAPAFHESWVETAEVAGSEIAHVLSIGFAGDTKAVDPVDAVRFLQRIALNQAIFQKALAANEVAQLTRPDGLTLIFFTTALAAMRCGLSIAADVKRNTSFQLRMGVHSGPVSYAKDISGGLAGKGIDLAQSLMQIGGAGHMLLSGNVADVVLRLSSWASQVHDLGEHDFGGVRLRVFSFIDEATANVEQTKPLASLDVAPERRLASGTVPSGAGESTVNECLEEARTHYFAGRFHQAVQRFTEGIRLQPDSPDAYAGRARAYAALGQPADAMEDYDEAIRLRPRVAQFYVLRAEISEAVGKPAAALADLNEAIRLDPCCADAYCQRAGLTFRSGDLLLTIDDCSEAIRLRPDDAAAYRQRGQAYAGLGRMAESRQDQEEADRMALPKKLS
jgi:tetratricopeptide (TPR) repeat protein